MRALDHSSRLPSAPRGSARPLAPALLAPRAPLCAPIHVALCVALCAALCAAGCAPMEGDPLAMDSDAEGGAAGTSETNFQAGSPARDYDSQMDLGGEGAGALDAGLGDAGVEPSLAGSLGGDQPPPSSSSPAPSFFPSDEGSLSGERCLESSCEVNISEVGAGAAWLSCGDAVYVNDLRDPQPSLWRLDLATMSVGRLPETLSQTPVACVERAGEDGARYALFWLLSDEGEWSLQLTSWRGEVGSLGERAEPLSALPEGERPAPPLSAGLKVQPAVHLLAGRWGAAPPVSAQRGGGADTLTASVSFAASRGAGAPEGHALYVVEATLSLNAGAQGGAPALSAALRAGPALGVTPIEVHARENGAWSNVLYRTTSALMLHDEPRPLLPSEGLSSALMSLEWAAWQTPAGVFLKALAGPQNAEGPSETLQVDLSQLSAPVLKALSDDLLLLSDVGGVEGGGARWFAYDLRARRLLPLEPLAGVDLSRVWLQGRWLIWTRRGGAEQSGEGGEAALDEELVSAFSAWRLPVAIR